MILIVVFCILIPRGVTAQSPQSPQSAEMLGTVFEPRVDLSNEVVRFALSLDNEELYLGKNLKPEVACLAQQCSCTALPNP